MLNFKLPTTTREHLPIKFYEGYDGYIHGAYFLDDMWVMATWTLPHGFHLTDTRLDLINEEPYEHRKDI